MKKISLAVVLILFFLFSVQTFAAGIYYPIPDEVALKMKQYSWRKECPVPIDELAYLKVPYWGYDGKKHEGELIVHKLVSKEVLNIFKKLYSAKFPIKQMLLTDEYGGNDEASMNEDNSSAFNCRVVGGTQDVLSKHSYGKAIDINPIQNPYVKNHAVEPVGGNEYLLRGKYRKGMILPDDIVVRSFAAYGWKWGGDWKSLKDYQHFEKD